MIAQKSKNSERGAALITVMFVFSIAAIISMALVCSQQLDIRRADNMLNQAQAFQYALGAEEYARQILASDANTNPGADYFGQNWAKAQPVMAIEQGSIAFSIQDMQGRFNINTLAHGSVAPAEYFRQLLISANLSPESAGSITSQLAGMIANKQVLSTQLLRRIDGMSDENYKALQPYITALPEQETALNVNTASDALLGIYVSKPDIAERIRHIIAIKGFVSEMQLRSIGMNTRGLGVRSRYFGMTAHVQVNGHKLTLQSLIKRTITPAGQVYLYVASRNLSRD